MPLQEDTLTNGRLLAECTWPEVKAAVDRGAGAVLPVGATEQHGPHLPLGTDAIFAQDLALALAEPLDLLVAPPVTYGYRSRPLSGGGQGFVGTTSVGGRTLMALIEDVLRELIRHGFRRLVVLNWHFENQNFVYEAAFSAREPHAEEGSRIVILESPFERLSDGTMTTLFPEGFPGWETEHASIIETSLMLHLHPGLVRFDQAVDDQAERSPWYDVIPTPDEFVPSSGTLWKATQASAEKGELAWPEIVASAREALEQEIPVETGRG